MQREATNYFYDWKCFFKVIHIFPSTSSKTLKSLRDKHPKKIADKQGKWLPSIPRQPFKNHFQFFFLFQRTFFCPFLNNFQLIPEYDMPQVFLNIPLAELWLSFQNIVRFGLRFFDIFITEPFLHLSYCSVRHFYC